MYGVDVDMDVGVARRDVPLSSNPRGVSPQPFNLLPRRKPGDCAGLVMRLADRLKSTSSAALVPTEKGLGCGARLG